MRIVVLIWLALISAPAQGKMAALPLPYVPPGPSLTVSEQIKNLELADIFPPRDLSALQLDRGRLRVLLATGDVIPARGTDR
ncbi:MAG: hypothetical protein V1878_03110, partial [bacterium]